MFLGSAKPALINRTIADPKKPHRFLKTYEVYHSFITKFTLINKITADMKNGIPPISENVSIPDSGKSLTRKRNASTRIRQKTVISIFFVFHGLAHKLIRSNTWQIKEISATGTNLSS